MEIRSAEFVSSYVKLDQLPRPEKPEYAFIGRSNVGKSSLINMLTGRKYLAKISSTPGKTQTINHFIINNEWYLVDLPGFGYAKTSKTLRALWKGFTFEYLKQRENLLCVCVLLDSRLEPQKIDLEFMEWLGKNGIPFVMVFTKADKNTKRELVKNLENYQRKMLETWEFLPQIFVTSSEKQTGKEELLAFFDEVNERF